MKNSANPNAQTLAITLTRGVIVKKIMNYGNPKSHGLFVFLFSFLVTSN